MYLRLSMPMPTMPWPKTAADALAAGVAYYMPDPVDRKCPRHFLDCKHTVYGKTQNMECMNTLYFAITEQPICIAWDLANEAYIHALNNGDPSNPTDAVTRGYDYFWLESPGRTCGHVGMRTISGKCYLCEADRLAKRKVKIQAPTVKQISPRQLALDAGEKWYMPAEDDLCRNGHHARRRVDNGVCEQCQPQKNGMDARRNDQSPHRLFPDMVIDAAMAKALGYKVYRTGRPCRQGHTGWRYISTNNCLDCIGR